MKMFLLLLLVAVGTYAIYKMLMWSRAKGKPDGNIAALIIALVMLYGVKLAVETPEPVKPPVKQASASNVSVPSRPTSSSTDTQVRSQIKAYMDRLPGAMIVVVRGDSAGIIVETDYNFGTSDKETAKSLATNLIYQIMDDNSDCTFKYISVNCMNGKNPVGAIVNYENGSFSTLP